MLLSLEKRWTETENGKSSIRLIINAICINVHVQSTDSFGNPLRLAQRVSKQISLIFLKIRTPDHRKPIRSNLAPIFTPARG